MRIELTEKLLHYVSLLPAGRICEMASRATISVPSFIAVWSGIQVMLRSLPQQFDRLSVGITDLKDSHCHSLRWNDACTKFTEDR